MKKSLVALSLLSITSTAYADINLYNADGINVNLSGTTEIQFTKGFDKTSKAKINLDDGSALISTSYTLSNETNVVSGVGLKYNNDDKKVENDYLYVGLSNKQFGTLTVGRQYLVFDDAGIGMDYNAGIGLSQNNADQLNVATNYSNVVKYIYDNGTFYAGFSHKLDDAAEGSKDNSVTDGRIGVRVGGLDTRVYYIDSADQSSPRFTHFNERAHILSLESQYTFENWVFAASYTRGEETHTSATAELYSAAVSYAMNKTVFALGYNHDNYDMVKSTLADTDKQFTTVANKTDCNNVYFNVTQTVRKNITVYGELGWLNTNNSPVDYDLSYTAGMAITF